MNIFVFDIETVPDVATGRRLYDIDDLDDKNVARVMFHKRAEESGGSEFLRHHLHRIVAISVVLRTADRFKVWTLGDPDAPEEEILTRFFDGIRSGGQNVQAVIDLHGVSIDNHRLASVVLDPVGDGQSKR